MSLLSADGSLGVFAISSRSFLQILRDRGGLKWAFRRRRVCLSKQRSAKLTSEHLSEWLRSDVTGPGLTLGGNSATGIEAFHVQTSKADAETEIA